MPAPRSPDGGYFHPRSPSARGGITFRDACALAVIGSLTYDLEDMNADSVRFDQAAQAAYRMADAMIRARSAS